MASTGKHREIRQHHDASGRVTHTQRHLVIDAKSVSTEHVAEAKAAKKVEVVVDETHAASDLEQRRAEIDAADVGVPAQSEWEKQVAAMDEYRQEEAARRERFLTRITALDDRVLHSDSAPEWLTVKRSQSFSRMSMAEMLDYYAFDSRTGGKHASQGFSPRSIDEYDDKALHDLADEYIRVAVADFESRATVPDELLDEERRFVRPVEERNHTAWMELGTEEAPMVEFASTDGKKRWRAQIRPATNGFQRDSVGGSLQLWDLTWRDHEMPDAHWSLDDGHGVHGLLNGRRGPANLSVYGNNWYVDAQAAEKMLDWAATVHASQNSAS